MRSFVKYGHAGALSGFNNGFFGWLRGMLCIMGGGRPFGGGGYLGGWEGGVFVLMGIHSVGMGPCWRLCAVSSGAYITVFIFFQRPKGPSRGSGFCFLTKVFFVFFLIKQMELREKKLTFQ